MCQRDQGGSPGGVFGNALDYDIVGSEFELESGHFVYENRQGNDMNN